MVNTLKFMREIEDQMHGSMIAEIKTLLGEKA